MNQVEKSEISAEELSQILKAYKGDRIFLVTGKKSFEECGASKCILDATLHFSICRFSKFNTNPELTDVAAGVQEFNHFQPNVIIAIGGGSVIDMAKLICYFSGYHESEYLQVLDGAGNKKRNEMCPLIAIPTTSGTGSEATHFAVVYNNKKKYSVADYKLLPNISILNFKFTESASPYLIASTGLDALSQAIESFWSVHSNEVSKKYAKESIELALEFLPQSVAKDSSALRQMMKASNLAGKAINITKTTAPHAMSYVFTSYFHIPHGHAVALTLPSIFEFNYGISEIDLTDKRGCNYVKNNLIELSEMFGSSDVSVAVQKLKELIASIGIETKLSTLGISEKDIQFMTNNMNYERLKNNPRVVSKEAAITILMDIL